MKRLLPILILLLPGCRKRFEDVWSEEGGTELEYRLLIPDTTTCPSLSSSCAEILNRRFATLGFKYARSDARGNDRIVVRISERNRANLPAIREILRIAGRLTLMSVDREPASFSSWKTINFIPLVPVVSASDFKCVTPERGQEGWLIRFAFTEEAAQRLNLHAEILHSQIPSGQIEIVMDGKPFSRPVTFADAFHGHGEISGGLDETAARNLAAVLWNSQLPCPLGRYDRSSKPVAGQPESEHHVPPAAK